MTTPRYDVVLFGATGFVGQLTAEYLARNAPEGLRWALAGRNQTKLRAVRDSLAQINPELFDLALAHADSSDREALDALAASTRVLISTVGPYLLYGEPVVAACAAAGTDYVDLTGEAEFVDRMFLAHHDAAVRSGARLVHSCGFDSIPHDLGAFFTVQQLPDDEPITLRGVVRSNGAFSGGTFHSALTAMSRADQAREAAGARRRAETGQGSRGSRAVMGRPHRDPQLGYWLLPLPTIDPEVVARSSGALPEYGPDFRYSHYAGTKTLRYAVGGAAAIAGLGWAARVGPLREWLKGRLDPGDGPSEERRARSRFSVDFVGETPSSSVHTRVSGGDPGYGETAKMLAHSALCLAFDDNLPTAGQVTTAQAMGRQLTSRLQDAGIRFEVF